MSCLFSETFDVHKVKGTFRVTRFDGRRRLCVFTVSLLCLVDEVVHNLVANDGEINNRH